MTREQSALLYLVRLSIGCSTEPCFAFDEVDWKSLVALSYEHGVAAIAVDGLQWIYDRQQRELEIDSPKLELLKYEWLANALNCERSYSLYTETISHLAKSLSGIGVKLLLLKGYGLSLNYPIPSHRPCGDIDIYCYGQWKEADALIKKITGVSIDRSHHHHTVSRFDGQMVENHYDFINTKAHKDAPAIEEVLKQLAEDSVVHELNEVKFYLPSATFNAIFLIRHAGQHFASTRITLRHLLDWGLFMKKHFAEVDWEIISPYLKNIGVWDFCCVLNSLCVDYLGMGAEYFPGLTGNKQLEERILNDILSPEFKEEPRNGLFRIGWYKARRWWQNRWKHSLIYNERHLPMFLTLVWSHIRKPEIN